MDENLANFTVERCTECHGALFAVGPGVSRIVAERAAALRSRYLAEPSTHITDVAAIGHRAGCSLEKGGGR